MITGFETNNRYDIKNNTGQMVYFVTEDTDDYTRNAYRTLRPFVLRVTDCMGREVMTMQRPFRCTCCCFCCPSARQEVRGQTRQRSHPLFFPDPTLHCTVVLLPKPHRRGLSWHSQNGSWGEEGSQMPNNPNLWRITKAVSSGFMSLGANQGDQAQIKVIYD